MEIGEDQSDAAASAAFSDVARERLERAQRTTSGRQQLPSSAVVEARSP
jgi:hypothetical protein